MKFICRHLRDTLDRSNKLLNYKQLRLDWGFTVYVTQVYLGLKPHLKGFYLSLEMWHGNSDDDGWKLKPTMKAEDEKADFWRPRILTWRMSRLTSFSRVLQETPQGKQNP
jgi:hypothetical protein